MAKASFGSVRVLPSGTVQVRYTWAGVAHKAPHTFATRTLANQWLAAKWKELQRASIDPAEAELRARVEARSITLAEYAPGYLAARLNRDNEPLTPKTLEDYGRLLRLVILPTFGKSRLDAITKDAVTGWFRAWAHTPSQRANAYGLLKAMLAQAATEGLVLTMPCTITGGASKSRAHDVEENTLTVPELAALVLAMPERYRAAVVLGAWCSLRFGEIIGLRRSDVDVKAGVVYVRQAVTRTKGELHIGKPKSKAGKRPVHVPPHVMSYLETHMAEHCAWGRDGLLFPSHGDASKPVGSSTFKDPHFFAARRAIGKPDLRFHDLRHTGAVLAAQTGATLAELMQRLGHSTPGAAMRYQTASQARAKAVAEAMAKLAM